MILFFSKIFSILFALPRIVQKGGGLRATFFKVLRIFHKEGIYGVKLRIRGVFAAEAANTPHADIHEPEFSVRPYYINPKLDSVAVASSLEVSVAVHLHLFHAAQLKDVASYLNKIPYTYDLYVSVPAECNLNELNFDLTSILLKVNSVVVESVPNIGADIAPFIVQFGKRLSDYGIVAHIHSNLLHSDFYSAEMSEDILSILMGSTSSNGGRVKHIIDLLQDEANIVFPEVRTEFIGNCIDWTAGNDLAGHLIEKYTSFSISDFPQVGFPEGSMFWARSSSLKDLFELSLNYDDLQSETITNDDGLVHALKRLVLLFVSKQDGVCLRIHRGDSIQGFSYYEEQQDYSLLNIHNDIKVLSYYLPQFHPIPENDLWHGKGFTEWTKVSSANPLFEGHYQQHIPHPDIGYYLLDSADTLRMQAEMMHKAGVQGQVFYHYWFSGKLILEEPAQLLLNSQDIKMPFCFCWANENWTRRWDGNEKEILLSQNYSEQDARDFIRYLIPFFKDSRYIKVEGRPVLFVYRPSSIPNSKEYLDIWESECAKVGIERPYVVAILTRGATNPKDFGMDAGVERVLHDWTSGSVPDIKTMLNQYMPINGSVLSYNDVADFYTDQKDAKDFTYFRSLVPIWDNTARYGSEAYVLHESTPQRFQEWMESTIAYAKATLPVDRRFVLINAWNEWAEGAHLEPDTLFGYSYLNSLGRALAGIPYSTNVNKSTCISPQTKLNLCFSKFCLNQLESDSNLKRRFLHCLNQSSIFKHCLVGTNATELIEGFDFDIQPDFEKADFTLEFRKVVFFNASVIEEMLQTACSFKSPVIANSYDGNSPLIKVASNGSVHSLNAYTAPLLMLPNESRVNYLKLRMSTKARVFTAYPSKLSDTEKPEITTIIRFHKSADLIELQNALFCLFAMHDCKVVPLIAAQDLTNTQIESLENTINSFDWGDDCNPKIHYYKSQDGNGDLRSKMLNESLKQVRTRYATFLDYDDLLMSHAYSWLIKRLQSTGKAVSFGRVWSTSYDNNSGVLLNRTRAFEYGYSYDDFISNNHAPLHSFMLDLEKVDLSSLVYFEEQRFMEDYLLTLQLFTKDRCDWDSLSANQYIGDYIHSVNRSHTLAFSDEFERKTLLQHPEYKFCEKLIRDMQKKIRV